MPKNRVSSTTMSTTTLLKCCALLVALSANAPGADALSCSSSPSSCIDRHHYFLQDSVLLEDLFFTSHRWPGQPSRASQGERGSHARQHRHHHEHKGAAKSTNKQAAHASAPSAVVPIQKHTELSISELFGGLPLDLVWTTAPAFQVREHVKGYEVEVDLPGVVEASIELSIDAPSEASRVRVLSLTAERAASTGGGERQLYAHKWELAPDVASGSIEAHYTGDGVLEIKAPKLPAIVPVDVPVQIHKAERKALPAAPPTTSEVEASKATGEPKAKKTTVASSAAAAVATTASVADKAVQALQASTASDAGTVTIADSLEASRAAQAAQAAQAAAQALEAAETIENLDRLLSLESKVKELKAKARARADARAERAETRQGTRRKEAVGKSNIEFAVEVEAASPAETEGAESAELDALSDEVQDLDADDVASEAALQAQRAPSHPGQPL